MAIDAFFTHLLIKATYDIAWTQAETFNTKLIE